MRFRNLAVAAAGMAFLAASSFAQITTIEGKVMGTDGNPIQKAVIDIVRTDIKGHYTVKTDKKGHYIYMGLPIGTYDISCVVEGKVMDKVSHVRTHPGDPIPVNFDLQHSAAAQQQQRAAMEKAMQSEQAAKDLTRGMTADQKAQVEKAMKDREAAMKHNKELNDAFNGGMAAMQAKNYADAITNFTKASEIDPKQPAVWAQLGDAYMRMAEGKTGPEFDTNIQKGTEAYGKAIELKPDDPATHNNYALALAKAKKFPECEAEFAKAAQLDSPNAGKYYYNLGAIMVNNGQTDAAATAFKKAIELTPTYADAYYQYGVTLLGKATTSADGKVVPAPGTVEAFQKYLDLDPNGKFSAEAKNMIATLGSTVKTTYENPNEEKKKRKR